MKIEKIKLELLFERVIQKMNELDVDSVEVKQNYYLLISSEDWMKIDQENLTPVVGSLVDDWQYLSKVVSGDNPMMFVDFDRLASILRAISEELNPSNCQKVDLKIRQLFHFTHGHRSLSVDNDNFGQLNVF